MAFKRPPQRRSNSQKKSNVWQIGRLKLNRSLRIPIIAFGLIIIYSVVSFVVNHYNPVKTIPAAQVSMDDSFSTTGYFIRQEKRSLILRRGTRWNIIIPMVTRFPKVQHW